METEVAALVPAARRGSADAWRALVERFQDLAVALALGRLGDLEAARDASQEAFALAFRHLDELAEPAAFPGWLARLVRTACARQHRTSRPAAVPLEDVRGLATAGPDPATPAVPLHQAD